MVFLKCHLKPFLTIFMVRKENYLILIEIYDKEKIDGIIIDQYA